MEIFKTAKNHLSSVHNYQPGKPLEELEREYGICDAVKMASNENALGPSPKALKAIQKNLGKIHRYPEGGCFYLREKLSRLLKVSEDSLVFGNGSDEILVLAVRAFAGAGDEVIIANPTFLIYEIASLAENASVVKVPMKNFHYDLEGMKNKIGAKTKLIFIANPDNPIGTYCGGGGLLGFLKAVPENVVVVLDEAYYEFAKEKKDYPDSLAMLKSFSNLVVTRTFSKAYGLSGLRVGYGIMNPAVALALNKVREPFNVNFLAQTAALAALDDSAHLKKTLEMVREGRKYLTKEFLKLKLFSVETVTNFVLLEMKSDAKGIYESLLKKGVIVRPMSAWGMPNFLRITIGKPSENKRFIEALKGVIP